MPVFSKIVYNRTQREALARGDVEKDMYIARDCGDASRGTKEYSMILKNDIFAFADYLSSNNKYVYELLTENSPLKMFFDLEIEKPDFSKSEMEELLMTFAVVIMRFVKLFYDVALTAHDFIILDSCRENKLSYHVICNKVYFSNMEEQSFFMKFLKHIFTQVNEGIHQTFLSDEEHEDIKSLCWKNAKEKTLFIFDYGVYTKNRVFRCIGQSKKGKENYILCLLEAQTNLFNASDTLVKLYGNTENKFLLSHAVLQNNENYIDPEAKPAKIVKTIVPKQGKLQLQPTKSGNISTIDFATLACIVENFSPERAKTYSAWLICVFAINESAKHLEETERHELLHRFSALSFGSREEYDNSSEKAENNETFANLKFREDGPKIGSLLNFLKEDNFSIFEQVSQIFLEKRISTLQLIYNSWKAEFEKNHCKIVDGAIYVHQIFDENGSFMRNTFLKSSTLVEAYRHLTWYIGKTGARHKYIHEWMDDPEIRCYEYMQMYPNPEKCPKNVFNLWQPFEYSKEIPGFEPQNESLDFFLNHLKILCNHSEESYDYVIRWIATCFQKPELKLTHLVFLSNEGVGKNLFFEILGRIMGLTRIFESTNPSRDVWGNFNSKMATAYIVNLSEVSAKDFVGGMGQFKALITDTRLTINDKGISAFTIDSPCKFITFTNNEKLFNMKPLGNMIIYPA